MSKTKEEEKPQSLASKLAEVAKEVAYVQKDSVNSFQNYKYASAEAVLSKVNEALTSRGIAISSGVELVNYHQGGPKESSNAIVCITLRFVDGATNEVLAVQGLGQGADKSDKAVMKANTAALKYCYANAFTISWGDDPEVPNDLDKTSAKTKKRIASSKASPDPAKGFKTVFTRTQLEEEISTAKLLLDLEKVKGKIVTMRGTDNYAPLVEMYKSRMNEIGGPNGQ
jgi:hypothetical protein